MITDETFWIVAMAIYAIDHVKFIDPREMIVRETFALKLVPEVKPIPFTLAGRCVALLNPFLPYTAALRFRWLNTSGFGQAMLKETDKAIRAFLRDSVPIRVIATLAFLSFFVAGTVLTSLFGLGQTLIYLAPLHVGLIAALSLELWSDSRGLSGRQAAALVAECAICPMYFPAVMKRILWRRRWEADGVAYARAYTLINDEFEQSLEYRLTEMSETCEPEERSEIEDYRAKLGA